MRKKKLVKEGQYAMEFMMVTAIGLLIVLGFVHVVNMRVQESKDDRNALLAEQLAQTLAKAAHEVETAGPGAKKVIKVEFPEGITSICMNDPVDCEGRLDISVQSGSASRKISYPFSTKIQTKGEKIDVYPGIHTITFWIDSEESVVTISIDYETGIYDFEIVLQTEKAQYKHGEFLTFTQ